MLHKLTIPYSIQEEVNRTFAALLPEEGCGFLLGNGGMVSRFAPAENLLHSPIAYRMNPVDQIQILTTAEDENLEILAIIHSHPRGPDTLSKTDLAEAAWVDLCYVIVSFANKNRPAWRSWFLSAERHTESPLEFTNLLKEM